MNANFSGTSSGHTSNVLGMNIENEQYEAIAKFPSHTYTVAPPTRSTNQAATNHIARLLGGSLNPTLTVDMLEKLRERIQVADKREQQKHYQNLSQVWLVKLAQHFRNDERRVDHAEIERMFYPTYAPAYRDAVRALDLPRKRWWSQEHFAALEHLARMPLSRVDLEHSKFSLSFEEWYHLQWNFYMPFNPIQFVCAITGEPAIWTRELVDSLSHYCRDRIDAHYSSTAPGSGNVTVGGGGAASSTTSSSLSKSLSPILLLCHPVGKLAFLMNQTKILQVPVLASNEKPSTNPYLLKIPPQKQAEFALKPVQAMKDPDALDKYKPALVLMTNMRANVDISSTVRRFGSVKEYLTIGIADSYAEGHGWDTFGAPQYRDRNDATTVPAFMADGFERTNIKTVSRWMLHKHDSRFVCGLGSVQSFARQQYKLSVKEKINVTWLGRLRPPVF